MKSLLLALCLMGLMVGCDTQPISNSSPPPDFDLALASFGKSEYHTGCGDFDRVAAMIDAWCVYLEQTGQGATDSKACMFLDSVYAR